MPNSSMDSTEPEKPSDLPPPDNPQEKDPRAIARGKKGGRIGGPRRAAKLTAKKRSDIARKAALARWNK